ncbi:hypothetical protein JCM6882_006051 [Rhodosporidiobolus microsporus]
MATPPDPSGPLPPNPHLLDPVLFCSGFSSDTPNEALVDVLKDCLRCRLNIERDGNDPTAPAHGQIQFETLYKTELAYATCNNQRLSSTSSLLLSLSPSGPSADPSPSPTSTPRLIKQLPLSLTPAELFALARPFGPIHSLTFLLAPPPPHAPAGSSPRFKGHALLHFYTEEDAQRAQEGLHFSEVGGQNIAVSLWDVKRGERAQARASLGGRSASSAYSPQASPKAPQNGFEGSPSARTSRWAADQAAPSTAAPSTPSKYPAALSAGAREFTPPHAAASREMRRDASAASQWSVASGEGSPAAAAAKTGGIDPCNLFIKSLPSTLLSPHLHALFSPYGQIVSARVMSDPSTGRSKEFGFVSFTTPSAAENARRAVDGQWVAVVGEEEGEVRMGEEARGRDEARRVTVRVHERKEVRQARASGTTAELEQSFAGLSTASTPDRPLLPSGVPAPAPSTPSPAPSPSASRWASPSPSPAAAAAGPKPVSPAREDLPAAPLSERERLREGVEQVLKEGDGGKVDEVVGLLESLPKKDRALCLFNPSVLAQKVQDALAILGDDDDGEEEKPASSSSTSATAFATPAAPSPSSAPAPSSSSLADLSSLHCSTLLPLLRTSPPPAGLVAPAPEKVADTDAFMDGLEGKPVSEVKQKLGERVFKAIKAGGVKGAPRITIELLDSEPDLRALAHVAAEWPDVLKAKAEKLAAEMKAKAAAGGK